MKDKLMVALLHIHHREYFAVVKLAGEVLHDRCLKNYIPFHAVDTCSNHVRFSVKCWIPWQSANTMSLAHLVLLLQIFLP